MSEKNTVVRALHDIGLAAWFGGSLMGAVGLNGAAGDVSDPAERARVASSGWARWTPVNAGAIGLHLAGGLALLAVNRDRVRHQPGVAATSAVKTAVTLAALATTAYRGRLGAEIAAAGRVPAEGGTVPGAATPDDTRRAMDRQRVLQWVTPALTGALVVVAALQGEQQRPVATVRSWGRAARGTLPF